MLDASQQLISLKLAPSYGSRIEDFTAMQQIHDSENL